MKRDTKLTASAPCQTPVAIIGIGCLFPKAPGLKDYWRLLVNGIDAITDVPETHWSAADYFDPDPKRADHVYCRRGGFLSAVPFDPAAFGIPPRNLEATDSSQLLSLMAARMALDDAGYGGKEKPFDRSRTSVIIGVTGTQELVIPLGARLGHPHWRRALAKNGIDNQTAEAVIADIGQAYVPWQENSFPGLLGNVVAGRICNRLDLGGTNCVVDAACASSFSAVNLALLELSGGRCDMALTGGVDCLNDIFMHMCFAKTHILSATGDVRPFAEAADGTLLAEGVGVVVLKRLADAVAANDRIYAVIRGLGASSDGRSQSIYAPNAKGQIKALERAYANAGVNPATIGLIEAHGTGTRVGDQVEVSALKQFFTDAGMAEGQCALGSVKSMIGHAKAAAGVAGLIKTALALHYKVLPPTLKADPADPKLELDQSPLYLNPVSRPWLAGPDGPRRAGVSAFGFGGSNFHIVLEEHRGTLAEAAWDGSVDILALAAGSRAEMIEQVKVVRNDLAKALSQEHIAAVCARSRAAFDTGAPCRLLCLFEPVPGVASAPPLEAVLDCLHTGKAHPDIFWGEAKPAGRLAMVFPGQGSQYPDMGRDLLCRFPETRDILARADEGQLAAVIYPRPTSSRQERDRQAQRLRDTRNAQPAIGAVSAAMLAVLERFGVRAEATCGHSFGELTALLAAGWLTADDFHRLAAARGKAMAQAGADNGTGAMLAVRADVEAIATALGDVMAPLVLANRNSPEQNVLSGPEAAIDAAARRLSAQGLKAVKLPVSAAFHSPMMAPAAQQFARDLAAVAFTPTPIGVYANVTGGLHRPDPDNVRRLLIDQITAPVDFVADIKAMAADGITTFVEVGPKTVLSGLIRAILSEAAVVALDRSAGKASGLADLARALCQLAALGHRVDISRWETPATDPKIPAMHVMISGANYRRPTPAPAATDTSAKPPTSHQPTATNDQPPTVNRQPATGSTVANVQYPISNIQHPNTMTTPPLQDQTPAALKALEEGLKAIQALQLQTAQAHQKFLETQAEASRTIQVILGQASHRPLSVATLPLQRAEVTTSDTRPQPAEPVTVFVAPVDSPMATASPAAVMPEKGPSPAVTAAPVQPVPLDRQPSAPADQAPALNAVLLAVVSELTGYPVETLALDMDIEADLGIDSIKRVEILSTLEERIAGLEPVSPEVMAGLKTLGQIAAHLQGAASEAPAPAATGVAAAGTTWPAPAPSVVGSALTDTLLAVVSELTGYPVETLALDMDIEADLSIDSIKRVEILSTLEERIAGLEPVSPEVMASLKTLGQIAAHLAGAACPAVAGASDPAPCSVAPLWPPVQQAGGTDTVAMQVVRTQAAVLEKGRPLGLASAATVVVAAEDGDLGKALGDELERRGLRAMVLNRAVLRGGEDDLPRLSEAAGLIIVAGARTPEGKGARTDTFLKNALLLARNLGPALEKAAEHGAAFLATVSRMDGALGFGEGPVNRPATGALAGLTKTAALEWPAVTCRALDVAPQWTDNAAIAGALADELLFADPAGPLEVGLGPDARVVLELAPYQPAAAALDLGPDDVVVVTGGGRGVTASAALALAEAGRPKLALIGRSPAPAPEPAWVAGLTDAAAIKQAIAGNIDRPTPRRIETVFRELMAGRQINASLAALTAAGSQVLYFSADVGNRRQLAGIFKKIRAQLGPVRALIHGAGVLEDRLITDKTAAQFEAVFGTKVGGLDNLLAAADGQPLGHIVLFSSVSARFGNKGQADYAMANEALNKIARELGRQRPDCRVLALNWGPWDGGMVTPALKKQFQARGVALIPTEAGSRMMVELMAAASAPPVEIVVGASLAPPTRLTPDAPVQAVPADPAEEPMALAVKRHIDTDGHPILSDHVIDGRPVVPMALMVEWLGHGALHDHPGLVLHGMDELRVLAGIKLERDPKAIRLMAGRCVKKEAFFEVGVEIRDGVMADGRDMIHARGKAILAHALTAPPAFDLPAWTGRHPYGRSIDAVYETVLFHGRGLRALRRIDALGPEGMVAQIAAAPSPHAWISQPLRSRWIADPLVLDGAFQMAIVWCHETRGLVCLPSLATAFRQYRERFPADGVTAVMEVRTVSAAKMKADFTFLDGSGTVVATLSGVESVMDPTLAQSFARRQVVRAAEGH